jgi:hypothetical protein
LIPTNFDGNHRPKLNYFPPFAPYLGKCPPLARNFDWAKHSKQDLIPLKLKFSKAYDKISWTFMFYLCWRSLGWHLNTLT